MLEEHRRREKVMQGQEGEWVGENGERVREEEKGKGESVGEEEKGKDESIGEEGNGDGL